jgi:hypothetical protein
VNRLYGELKAITGTPDVQDHLTEIGMMPISSPAPGGAGALH